MTTRYLTLCTAVLVACGPEVKAGDAPSLQGLEQSQVSDPVEYGVDAPSEAPYAAAANAIRTGFVAEAGAAELSMPAIFYSDRDADVSARMIGVVRTITVELGDAVSAGQVLAVLEDARESARLAAASAALERARADHERMEGLHGHGFVTASDLDEARYQLRAAEAALGVAQAELQYTRVLAPFSGVVTRRYGGLGRPVAEGEPLFRVTALQPLRASARLPERYARGLRRGTVALLTDSDGATVEAQVARVAPAVDPGSGTVEVLFSVPKPGPFLPGSSATLRLPATVVQPQR